jgi:hypothetical protein
MLPVLTFSVIIGLCVLPRMQRVLIAAAAVAWCSQFVKERMLATAVRALSTIQRTILNAATLFGPVSEQFCGQYLRFRRPLRTHSVDTSLVFISNKWIIRIMS